MMVSVSDAVSQWQRCPFCGGALGGPLGTSGQGGPTCPDCGRVAHAPEQPYYGVYGTVEYDFDDVTPADRAEAAELLVGAGIPYRWDDGYRLLVSTDHEDDVDALFGHIPEDDEDQKAGEGVGASEDVQRGDGGEPTSWAADEEAARALGRLFDAADRLRHRPDDEDAAAELADAAGVVLIAPLPFGMNTVLWATAGMLGRQLVNLLEAHADDEDVAVAADALRSVLRDHV